MINRAKMNSKGREDDVDVDCRINCVAIREKINAEMYNFCSIRGRSHKTLKKLTLLAPPPGSSHWFTLLELTLMSDAVCKSSNVSERDVAKDASTTVIHIHLAFT